MTQNGFGSNSGSQTAFDHDMWRVETTFTTQLAGAGAWVGRITVDEFEL